MNIGLSVVGGLFVGLLASSLREKYNWSLVKTLSFILILDFFAAFLIVFFSIQAKASEEITTKLKETTVHINYGTGFIVEAKSGTHYLVTNFHVCNVAAWLGKMRSSNYQDQLVSGVIIKSDPYVDLCAAKVSSVYKALKVADKLELRERVYTRGYPYGVLTENSGLFLGGQTWAYTYPIEEIGKCPKLSHEEYDQTRRLRGCTVVYHDSATSLYSRPGSSGSPVVDGSGRLVGVMSSWDGDNDSGGMVSLSNIKKFLSDL